MASIVTSSENLYNVSIYGNVWCNQDGNDTVSQLIPINSSTGPSRVLTILGPKQSPALELFLQANPDAIQYKVIENQFCFKTLREATANVSGIFWNSIYGQPIPQYPYAWSVYVAPASQSLFTSLLKLYKKR